MKLFNLKFAQTFLGLLGIKLFKAKLSQNYGHFGNIILKPSLPKIMLGTLGMKLSKLKFAQTFLGLLDIKLFKDKLAQNSSFTFKANVIFGPKFKLNLTKRFFYLKFAQNQHLLNPKFAQTQN